ncbi:MAG: hypothetical protein DHS20C11_38510 [Lysobacteraceae bacterium]|nr:MAG: hypothetical protein DHS20C11_38510 [Xanthomonadaceae bacterium]
MPIKYVRIILVAVATEVLAILALVLAIIAFGPSDPDAAQVFAEKTGYWLGPLAGFVFCLIGGWFVARNLASHQLINGLLVGVVAAIIDIALLFAMGSEFQLIFVASNTGRVVAGLIGGWLGKL